MAEGDVAEGVVQAGRLRGAAARLRQACGPVRKPAFSGPLASFVGKNFDTRQDACWGQLRDEAVCSPPARHTIDR